ACAISEKTAARAPHGNTANAARGDERELEKMGRDEIVPSDGPFLRKLRHEKVHRLISQRRHALSEGHAGRSAPLDRLDVSQAFRHALRIIRSQDVAAIGCIEPLLAQRVAFVIARFGASRECDYPFRNIHERSLSQSINIATSA